MDIKALQKQIKSHKTVVKPLHELLPYARNSRKHEDWQVAKIAASIKEFGFTNPVLIDEEGTIIAGHARVMASLKLDLAEVPCIVLSHLNEAQRRAYVIADNKLNELSSWDDEILKAEIQELNSLSFDLELLGLDRFEIEKYTDQESKKNDGNDNGETYKSMFEVVVECGSESEQEQIFNQLSEMGLKCRVLSM